MAAEGWRGELEAQKFLLTKQQSQIDTQRSQIATLQKQLDDFISLKTSSVSTYKLHQTVYVYICKYITK